MTVRRLPALSDRALPWAVFALAFALQWPLVLNPGYYSHDELQWALRAAAGTPVPWAAIGDYQYRPLTFGVWMWLSRHLFEQPMLFHAACVAWGSANAALLSAAARRMGLHAVPALVGALVFALGPSATYTHGWVGTIADLLWVSCALAIAWGVARVPRAAPAAAVAAVFTTVALLGKEAAIAIPPMLAAAWLLDPPRRRAWLAATVASGVVVCAYLALRFDALLQSPAQGSQYTLGAWHVPMRWLEYQVFPLAPKVLESFSLLRRGITLQVAAAFCVWCALMWAVWRASPRALAAFLLGGTAALSAALPLASTWNHYAYAYAAITAMAVAAAWPTATRGPRTVIALSAAIVVLHGFGVMWAMREVGKVQSVFSPALADVLRRHPGQVELVLAPDARAWIFPRLVHEVPSYAGVPIGERVQLVEDAARADYRIEADGRLSPLR